VEPTAKPSWTALGHISQLFHFEPALQHGRTDPVKDMYKLFGVWECFSDATVPTARKRAENAMQVMVRLGINIDDLARMPYGIAQPIREALRTCQSVPSGDWPVQAYQLALRPDLAQMVIGDSTHVASRDSFRQVNKHLVSSCNMPMTAFALQTFVKDPSVSRMAVGELLDEVHAAMSPEPAALSGVDLDLGDFTDIRFGNDRRLQEVARMLQSSTPAAVKMPERHDLT